MAVASRSAAGSGASDVEAGRNEFDPQPVNRLVVTKAVKNLWRMSSSLHGRDNLPCRATRVTAVTLLRLGAKLGGSRGAVRSRFSLDPKENPHANQCE